MNRSTDPANSWWNRARSHPEHVALVADGQSWTDRQLMAAVSRRVRLLGGSQRPPEPRLAIAVSSDLDRVAWMMAATWVGLPFVSLALEQPAGRTANLLRRLAPVAVLTDRSNAHLAAGHRLLQAESATTDSASTVGPLSAPVVAEDSVVHLCFTSGSSGAPKAVEVPYGSIAHAVEAFASHLGPAAPRHHILATSWAFDVAMLDLWLALATTGTLVVPARENLLDHGLRKALTGFSQPVIQMVPSVLSAANLDPAALPDGTTIVLGGERAPSALVERFANHVELHIAYGVTEGGVCSTAYRVPPGTTDFDGCIGRALAQVELSIVDRDGRQVGPEEIGELLIGGPGLASGYFDDPAATAQAFTDHGPHGTRVYRTGDLVHRDEKGLLYFHTRRDDQLQIRGHRVEPAELETVLRSIPGVADAAVVGSQSQNDSYLCAYLERAAASAYPDIDQVLAVVERQLPAWMWPRQLCFLPALPRTHTGKVARRELPPIDPASPSEQALVRPGDQTEDAVARAWKDALGTVPRSRDSTFLAEGGTSLNAAQISAAVSHHLGTRLSSGDVLAARTFADLVAAARRAPAADAAVAATEDRATVLQRDIWLTEQLEPGTGIYNLVVGVELQPDLRNDRLQRALHLLEQIHPALRYGYAFRGEELERVHPTGSNRPLITRTVDAQQWDDHVAVAVRQQADSEFDLEAGRLWRYELLHAEDDRAVLILCFHHIAVDGIAVQVLLGQLADLVTGRVDPAELTTDAGTQGGTAVLRDRPEHLEYWRDLFRSAQAPTRLPGQCETASSDHTAHLHRFTVERHAGADLHAGCTARGFTLQEGVLTSVVRTIATAVNSSDVTLGIAVSRRGVDVPPEAIGQYAAALPVRFTVPPNMSAERLLTTVAATVRGVVDHCDVDPRDVLAIAREETRGGVGRPPFPMVFSWNEPHRGLDLGSTGSTWRLEFTGRVTHDLLLELAYEAEELRGALHVKRAANAGVDVEALMDSLQENIRTLSRELTSPAPAITDATATEAAPGPR